MRALAALSSGSVARGCWRPRLLGPGLGVEVRAIFLDPGGKWGQGGLDFLVSRLERSIGKSDIGELKFLPFPHITSIFRSQFSFIYSSFKIMYCRRGSTWLGAVI